MNSLHQTLQEQSMGENPNDLRYTSITLSPAEIRKAGGSTRIKVQGVNWRIRSDFPVQIYADGIPIALVGPYGPEPGANSKWFQAGPWITLKRPVKEFVVCLLGQFGGQYLGGATDDFYVYRIHGHCVIEGTPGSWSEPQDVNPDLLPVHTWVFATAVIGLGTGPLKSLAIPEALWQAGFQAAGRLPKEIWIKAISVSRELNSLFPATTYCYEVVLWKDATPINDDHKLVVVKGSTPSYTVQLPNVKLPLYSLYSPYAAETPQMRMDCYHNNDAAADTTIVVAITASYRF